MTKETAECLALLEQLVKEVYLVSEAQKVNQDNLGCRV